MRVIFYCLVFTFLFSTIIFGAEEETIMVGKCRMNVISMQSPEEHSRGLLGYTERTFYYDGMLFDMKRDGRKVFHTMGMQMPIRIMGVTRLSEGVYKVVGDVYYAAPGIQSIRIEAPDVLEIPESKYRMRFKNCLMATEGTL